MTTPSPGWVAEMDQRRAEASERVDRMIELYREILADNAAVPSLSERAFGGVVALTLEAVDPDDSLCDEHGCRVVQLSETLALAIERLAAK